MIAAMGTTRTEQKLRHAVVFYRTENEYLDCVVPLAAEWLNADRPVLITLPERRIAMLRSALAAHDGSDDLALTDVEVDPLQHLVVAEVLVQAPHLDGRDRSGLAHLLISLSGHDARARPRAVSMAG